MTNLDKVYSVWRGIEGVYAKQGKGKSRYDFAVMMIGPEDALIKLRERVNKDFDGSSESIEKLNTLFSVLERARQRLKEVDEIEDLEDFVWSSRWGKADEGFSLLDCNPTVRRDYAEESVLVRNGYFDSYFRLVDGKVERRVANPNSKKMITFSSAYQVLAWMSGVKEGEESKFVQKVYSILNASVAKRELKLPICFLESHECLGKSERVELPALAKWGEWQSGTIPVFMNRVETVRGSLPVVQFV